MQNHVKRRLNNTNVNVMAAIAIGAMLVFSIAGTKAFADVVLNDVVVDDKTVSITAGEETVVRYQITVGDNRTPTGDRPGCNVNGANPGSLTVNTPAGVTATPSSLTISACDTWYSVTFTSETTDTYQITVDVTGGRTDSSYDESGAAFTLAVEEDTPTDNTPPELTLPDDITEEATSADGAIVTYSASANDAVDGSVDVTCTPASGSTFPLGETTVTCTATDAAENEATDTFAVTVQDTIEPVIEVTGTISDGQQFYFGDVPSAPTCTATDSGSGVTSAGCTVSGYSPAVGTHTLTFTATDEAGNTATQTITYKVLAWTIKGFYQPVDMNGVENTMKGGSTAPLKFEVFKGTTELTATSAIVTPLKATKVTCDGGATIDEIEALATGSTVLRYDSTGGQFIYNWQTPKQPGACYNATVTTQDGSSIIAEFELR
jgi:hypothetical protein